ETVDDVVRQALFRAEGREVFVAQTIQPAARTDPEIAFAVASDRPHLVIGEPVLRSIVRERTVFPTMKTAAIRSDPHRAIDILEQRNDFIAGQAVLRRKDGREFAVMEATQSAVGADEQIAVA